MPFHMRSGSGWESNRSGSVPNAGSAGAAKPPVTFGPGVHPTLERIVASMTTTSAHGIAQELVGAAVLAPSSHNTQPWRFGIRGDAIALRVDRTRSLPINDPEDRELTISCGAALFNLRVAAAHAGLTTIEELTPESTDSDLVAVVHLGSGAVASELAALHPSIALRHTCRGALESTDDMDTVASSATRAVSLEAATLAVFENTDRGAIAELVAAGDRRQFANRGWRAELASWMRPRGTGDGLPGGPLTRLAVRHVDLGRNTAKKDRRLALDAPVLAVLATPSDTTADWLAAGQALQRMLLTAATHGWQAGFLNQPCQVAELRRELEALLPDGNTPQLIARLGKPERPAKPAPRRAVANVVDHEAADLAP
jgi:hypothetical protein